MGSGVSQKNGSSIVGMTLGLAESLGLQVPAWKLEFLNLQGISEV